MQPLAGTYPNRYARDGSIVSATPYTAGEVTAVLLGPRYEVFHYLLQRIVGGTWDEANQKIAGGAWTDIADITNLVHSCTIRYDWTNTNVMGHATFEIVDPNNIINFQTDVIRCYHMVKMPDGNYVSWVKGTFHVPSPTTPFDEVMKRSVETDDSLRNLVDDKLTDYFTIPSPPPGGGYDDGDPITWAANLIANHYPLAGIDLGGPTAIRVPASEPKTYPPGTSYLDVVDDLLLYCNFDHLRADVEGSYISQPYIAASGLPIEYEYIADGASIIVRGASSAQQDYWNAPNRWLRIKSLPNGARLRSQLTLTDASHPLSTTVRGRIVTDFAFDDAETQAVLDEKVQKLYEEGQHVTKTVKIQTPLNPHGHRDIGALSWPTQVWGPEGNGVYILESWTFPMVAGGTMEQTYRYIATLGTLGTVVFGLAPFTPAAQPGIAPVAPLSPIITPGVRALVTTRYAPTISLSDNITVTPGVAAIGATRFAPVVGLAVSPDVVTLGTATFAPAISVGTVTIPDTVSLSTSTFAPIVTMTQNQTVTPGVATVALTTYAPDLGGDDMGIMDKIYEEFDTNTDPVDSLITFGNYRALVFYSSSSTSGTWIGATNADYTVPSGKRAIVLEWFSFIADTDSTARQARLRNITDSTDAISTSDFRLADRKFPWSGDGATATKMMEFAAGKRLRVEIKNADSTKRSMGGAVIIREVAA